MKSRKLLIGLALAITLVAGMDLALGGSVSQEQEAAIKQVLFKSQEAWNKGDKEGFLSTFSEDAQIMVGQERRIVSKEECSGMLPSLFDDKPMASYTSVKVTTINVSSATVKAVEIFSPQGNIEVSLDTTFNMIKDNKGRWLIQRSVYNIF